VVLGPIQDAGGDPLAFAPPIRIVKDATGQYQQVKIPQITMAERVVPAEPFGARRVERRLNLLTQETVVQQARLSRAGLHERPEYGKPAQADPGRSVTPGSHAIESAVAGRIVLKFAQVGPSPSFNRKETALVLKPSQGRFCETPLAGPGCQSH
jgi:hypothetical protein